MSDRTLSRVQDALDAARLTQEWVISDSVEAIANDPRTESAYTHQFTRNGEALRIVRDFDPEFAENILDVHQWIGPRHRIIHDYRELDLTLLWLAASQEIPVLIESLENLLLR